MTPIDFRQAAIKIYGRKKWQPQLADALGVNVATIHRMMHRPQIPGPYEVALKGMMENWKQRVALEKAARKLLPRKIRKRKTPKAVAS